MLVGCYIVAALVLVAACNDKLDIQTKYPFIVETMPVPKKLKVNETAEIRCELKREETFRLYYTSLSDDQSSLKVWVEDSFGQAVELEFSYNNDNSEEKGDEE